MSGSKRGKGKSDASSVRAKTKRGAEKAASAASAAPEPVGKSRLAKIVNKLRVEADKAAVEWLKREASDGYFEVSVDKVRKRVEATLEKVFFDVVTSVLGVERPFGEYRLKSGGVLTAAIQAVAKADADAMVRKILAARRSKPIDRKVTIAVEKAYVEAYHYAAVEKARVLGEERGEKKADELLGGA